jgi:multiple sugar transport system permease protein
VETLVFLGGLQNIPKEVNEAAALDSPHGWHGLWWITIPLITPMILFNLVIGIITSFQIFTQALVIGGTTGTPAESTLMYMVVIYRTAFRYFNIGYAAALATVLFLGVLLVTLLIFRTARAWVHYEGDTR